jgi:tRNA pseudouridine55 synthase
VVRKKLSFKKVGHTGTLDPNAAGVLPICVGQATKISQFLLDSKKRYRGELTLGIETDTQDAYGKVLYDKNVSVTEEAILNAFKSFQGEILQVPPMFSALKVKGQKLYELAREGFEVDRTPRRVLVEELNVLDIRGSKILFDIVCSKGTYVRTICKDIGDYLGTGGMMSFLLRTATGPFDISSAITLEEFQSADNVEAVLLPIDSSLQHMKSVEVLPAAAKAALNGNTLSLKQLKKNGSISIGEEVRVYAEGELIGIAEIISDGNNFQLLKFSRLLI